MVMVPEDTTFEDKSRRTNRADVWTISTDFPFSIAMSSSPVFLPLPNGKEWLFLDVRGIHLFPKSSEDESRDRLYWNMGDKYPLNSHQSLFPADVWDDDVLIKLKSHWEWVHKCLSGHGLLIS